MEHNLGLIGFPIKHSLSPWIHRQFLEKAKIKGTYSIFEINDKLLKNQIEKMKQNRFKGFNVTLPYKTKIIPYLDDLDHNARNIGAVNTVLNLDGRLIGYNTDGIGYLRSLQQYYPELVTDKQKNILLIGAGGAARGIYYALNQSGFNTIDIANRTIENANSIAELKINDTVTNILTLNQAEDNLVHYDVIIQTTNVGMKPNQHDSPIKLNHVRESAIVSDIIYQPIWTSFLKNASLVGGRVHHGHTMLLNQAQYAFEIWFGQRPELGSMDIQLKLLLEG